jgi:hypothetical protein
MHVVFVLGEVLLVVVLAACVLGTLDVIGSLIIAAWAPVMLVFGGAGTLGGVGLIIYAITQDNVWLGIGGVVGGLFFAWIFGQELHLASTRTLGGPGPN